MTLRATHELHERRKGRNLGLALMLLVFAGLVFAITVAKLQSGGPVQGFDHTFRPELIPSEGAGQ